MRLGFQEKIYLVVCLLLVLGTSSMGVLNYLSSKKSATEMVHNKLEAVAQSRAELVAKIIEKELEFSPSWRRCSTIASMMTQTFWGQN